MKAWNQQKFASDVSDFFWIYIQFINDHIENCVQHVQK